MQGKIEISIIIVSYKCMELLQKNLSSILSSSLDKSKYEVIVVDNASHDGTVEMIAESYPKVIVIENNANVGFGTANNIGAHAATGKYLFFLNPDAALKKDTLQQLASYNKYKKMGMLAPKLIFPNGNLQLSAHRRFPNLFTHLFQHSILIQIVAHKFLNSANPSLYTALEHKHRLKPSHVMGAAMLMPAKVFKKLGGFDEDYFLYFEETDLCHRLVRAGYEIVFEPSIKVVHSFSGSGKREETFRKSDFYLQSTYLFLRKNYSSFYSYTAFALTLCGIIFELSILQIAHFAKKLNLLGSVRPTLKQDILEISHLLRWHIQSWNLIK